MFKNYDLIILGGGIGGSALAITMARAGARVLLLEKSLVFEDVVRGEWISPWGVREVRRLKLYDLLVSAGGHHLTHHITYDETRSPEASEATGHSLGIFFEDVPGPLCLGHPRHCQALFDEAGRAGAETIRGVEVSNISIGARPSVTYMAGQDEFVANARLIVGADGRASMTRAAAQIPLSLDKPHHWFAGLLVDSVNGWDERTQAIGTEDKMGFLVFPQGGGKVRLYGGYALEEAKRFGGAEGPQRFLDAFNVKCCPNGALLAGGRPAGPLMSYFNHDSWTDQPFAEGVVLIGDAAGWNDPISGLGLSITYRDVRIVSDILLQSADWSVAAFEPYAVERRERMRRLRIIARILARMDMEFDDDARARRRRFLERLASDPSVSQHLAAILAGPETAAASVFSSEYIFDVLGEKQAESLAK